MAQGPGLVAAVNDKDMQVVVGSGKGGTGKTLLATALAQCWDGQVKFLDCDVEEPNSHIFLRPKLTVREKCTVPVPEIIREKCTFCGKCRDICRFNAITLFGDTIMTFQEMCHSCGGCFLVCADDAITETSRLVGHIESGQAGAVRFVHGRLRVGEAMSVPLIKAVKAHATPDCLVIVDAPPGTSCPFVATVTDADCVLLITEPTPFGLHDLQLSIAVVQSLGMPLGVIINRADMGDDRVAEWCRQEEIPILLEIPFSKTIAAGYAEGRNLLESMPSLIPKLRNVVQKVCR